MLAVIKMHLATCELSFRNEGSINSKTDRNAFWCRACPDGMSHHYQLCSARRSSFPATIWRCCGAQLAGSYRSATCFALVGVCHCNKVAFWTPTHCVSLRYKDVMFALAITYQVVMVVMTSANFLLFSLLLKEYAKLL